MTADFAALRKHAKRWLKAIRSGDANALAELERWLPGRSRAAGLRDVQRAIARERGFASWAALKEDHELRGFDRAGLAAEFLKHACLSYETDDWPSKWRRAQRIRTRSPEVVHASIHTASVSGDVEHVRACLARDPALAKQRGGPQNWPPLLFVCYGCLTGGEAVEVARALLDAGADPNSYFRPYEDGWRFTALTGAIGQGELGQPEHVQAEALARLLLERGASPNQAQALYNTHLIDDDTRWLEFLFEHGLDASALIEPDEPGDQGEPNAQPTKIFSYLLAQAAANGHVRRARWLLEHGADPNARSTYDGHTSYKTALIAGALEVAAALRDHGAQVDDALVGRDAFLAALARGDTEEAEQLLVGHREYLESAQPLIDAAGGGDHETVELLLKWGMDPNGLGIHGHRALHVGHQHREVTDLLFAYGADPRSRCFGGSVQNWARLGGDLENARYYAQRSRTLIDAVASGHILLAQQLLAADPACVHERGPSGDSALHELPEDVERATELITLLLAAGADPELKNDGGQTPAEKLEALGLDEVADALDAAR